MSDPRSLLDRMGTPEILASLADARTPRGWALADLARSGRAHPESAVGVYVGDEESYDVFAPLLEPMVEELAGPAMDPAPGQLGDLDPGGQSVRTTRIRIARNLAGHAFPPQQSAAERSATEALLVAALEGLPAETGGRYDRLSELTDERRAWLEQRRLLPHDRDRFMTTAGINRDWPTGRGVYTNEDGSLAAWVGEEDHLRLIALRPGGDLGELSRRLERALAHLASTLEFAYDEDLRYLTSCPSNLGEGMRAGVHAHLPVLAEDMEAAQDLAASYGLVVRGTAGEHTAAVGGVLDLSLRYRLRLDRRDHLLALQRGVAAFLQAEEARH